MRQPGFGHCKHCRYFGSPARKPLDLEEARCLQPHLQTYELVVFGASGCNAFELREGLTATVEPTAASPQ